jgi:hypothetical protein
MPNVQGIKSQQAQEAYPSEIKLTFESKEEFDTFILLLFSGRSYYYKDSIGYRQATEYLKALGK